jgi:predicted RNA-binding protein associated with RNAse of E/G family
MERKFVDRPNWKRMLKRRFKLSYIESNDFSGYVSAIFMDKVREPLIVEVAGRQLPIVDNGYIWLQHLPDNENYSITTMLDSQGNVVQWYFDITKQNGVSEEGIPYFDDLYLDVVILPSSDIIILDEDELQAALNAGEITKVEYDMAYGKADEIINGIGKDVNALHAFSNKYLEYIKSIAE